MANLYIRNTREPASRLKSVLVAILAVALLLSAVVLFLIASNQQTAEEARADFELALSGQDYAQALEIYRDVQARAVLPAEAGAVENPYQIVLTDLEALLAGRLYQIESQLLAGRTLEADDQAFIVGLGELTGLRLSRFARDLSRAYLMGEEEYQTMAQTIEQLAGLQNLKDSVLPLDREYQGWPALQPAFLAADRLLADQQWYSAYAAWD